MSKARVKDYDLKGLYVKTDQGEQQGDILILTPGCDRIEQLKFLRSALSRNEVSFEANDEYDELTALQVAAYLARKGKKVTYCGPILRRWDSRLAEAVARALELAGIRLAEGCSTVFPDCRPNHPFEFFSPNDRLEVAKNAYAGGDIVKGFPKVGELAMRTGRYIARAALGKEDKPFKPVVINVIKLPKGKALYIKTDLPWNGNTLVTKVSRFRYLTKSFLERYYLVSNGRMGLLENL